ncbi:MAG: hypothetical protein M1602_06030, partial [Firmicutes bacterium]|nr:hypothetical protein [Bacillota bacterium]
ALRGDRASLSLHVHNLRPLQENDRYVYQAWLVPAEGGSGGEGQPGQQGQPVPLPPFNTSTDGSGFCTVLPAMGTIALGAGARVVVTAEPRVPDPDRGATTVLSGSWATLQPVPAAPGGVQPGGPGREAQQAQEILAPIHPLAHGGGGTAIFDFTHDGLVVTLHDVPGPEVYGGDPVTSRPFNVYAGWLVKRESGDVAPLGFFRKVWPGTYRLQARRAAPLAAFDTLLVSAEDRAGAFDPLNRRAFSTAYSPSALPAAGAGQRV